MTGTGFKSKYSRAQPVELKRSSSLSPTRSEESGRARRSAAAAEDHLRARAPQLATRGRCSLCIGCVTASPNM